jgi:photosystem II stability/assembly factor-like uncharacterized protein
MNKTFRRTFGWVPLVFLIAGGAARGGVNRWTPIGPDGGVITTLAVGAGENPVVYAGTPVGVFRSADGGVSWTASQAGEVEFVVADPVRPGTVYASWNSALSRSTDAGLHWTPLRGGLLARALVIDPSAPTTLYAATRRAIYRSVDDGATWDGVYTAADDSPVSELTSLAVSRGAVYAGFVQRRCLVADFCPPVGGGVLRSETGASDWRIAGETSPVLALAVDPTNDTLYAGGGGTFPNGSGALMRSTDGGANWGAVGPRGTVVSVAVDPREPVTVYCGVYDVGVFRWTPGEPPDAPTLAASLWVSVAVEPTTGRVWAGSYEGVSTSATGSDGWTSRNRGIEGADLRALEVDPASETIWAGTYGGVYRTADAGATWEKHGEGLEDRLVLALRADPTNPSTLYAGTDAGVFRSGDGGETWSSSGPSAYIADVAVDPRSPSVVYAMAPEAGVFRSEDGGRSWGSANTGLTVTQGYALDVDRVTSTVYAGTYGGVFRSTDGGATWSAINTGLTNPAVFALRVAPSNGSVLYAGTQGGLFRTSDGGASWQDLGQYGASIAIDPLDADVVYTAAFGEALRSLDGGASWTASPGIPRLPVTALAVRASLPGAPARLYAATSGGGAYAISYFESSPCTPDATTLCLQNDRFQVAVDWRTADGRSGQGRAAPLTRESGYFWFRTASDVELAVKVLDGGAVNGHFWFFAGSLSSVAFNIHVTDSWTGHVRTYDNPLGRVSSFVDTEAFPGAEGAEVLAADQVLVASDQAGTCSAVPAALCVAGGRFQVAVHWRARDGRSGAGRAVPLTGNAGYFWFFHDPNVELVVKVLDGRSVNGHHWVFSGALSNVAYTITVTDTETGVVRTYDNPQGQLASFVDTSAF